MGDIASTGLAHEMETIATSTTIAKEADFESKAQACTLHATEDTYIAFDRGAQSGDFFLKADTMIDIQRPCEFTRVSALAVSSGGTLYIWARR